MPYSDSQGKDAALGWYQRIAPATVVDIGVGCGTYATLMREEPGQVRTGKGKGKTARTPRRDHWTGVEAWEPYIKEFGLRDLYDELVTADARDLESDRFAVDLVIAGDVLEHMKRDEAQALIGRIQPAAANLIVSIPVLHLPQGAVNGNPFEEHIDHWTFDQMHAALGAGVREVWRGNVLAYYWWQKD